MLSVWPGEPDRRLTRAVAVAMPVLGFVGTLIIFIVMTTRSAEDRIEISTLWNWVQTDGLSIDLAIQIDTLSILMMLIITGVGSLIIIYSTSYMDEDRDYKRFFAEMSFFIFAMLLLVEAANYFFLIVGWGLVGLASYLLIGYYYDRPSATAAAKKAFVVNVIGDVGMVLAAFLLVRELGTLDYQAVYAAAPAGLGKGSYVATAVCLLLFVGAAAKSAQVPLHTWLPDAMEGPTPVSALIHAATMVTAGVYMVVRSNVLYQLAPYASDFVAITGAVTLLLGASIAIVQVNIKRVLAWSTVSQIGYMIMAAGLGLYSEAMFHLMTHAFFKALLFLSVGMAIHALAGEQSLDKMGGLGRTLKSTALAVLVGCLAISGIPPFAGFWSKDAILSAALDTGPLGVVLGLLGMVGAGMTAFYMFRLFFRAFTGPEPEGGYHPHPHPPSMIMVYPVMVLAVLATIGGLVDIPGVWNPFGDWLEPALTAAPGYEATTGEEWFATITSLILVGVGVSVAWWLFKADPQRRLRLAGTATTARTVLHDQYRFDDVYEDAFVQTGRDLGDVLANDVERVAVQGSLEGTARGVVDIGRGLAVLQSGLVRGYVLAMVAGVAIVGIVFSLAVR